MTLREVKTILECTVIHGETYLDFEIESACGADLMSDVLSFIKTGALLLTGLTNIQSVRTAEIADVRAIVYVRGKIPNRDVIELAKEIKIPLLSTKNYMFEACGKLYKHGLRGLSEYSSTKNTCNAR